MGANAQTSVPTFTAGEILTAANMNISARTGIPVFADSTARDAAFGGTGEKTLAEGQFAYLESTNATQYYDGAAWQSVGTTPGLVLTATATPSAVSSVSINNCFSSTYAAYMINIILTASTGAASTLTFRFRASAVDTNVNYKQEQMQQRAASVSGATNSAGTDELELGIADATGKGYFYQIQVFNPNVADQTVGSIKSSAVLSGNLYNWLYSFVQTDSTQFDGLTIFTSGTNFTGTIRVYGYANS